MATRTESRFGDQTALGTTYTSMFTVTTSHTYNLHINITNRTGSSVNFRAYIADNSWSSGEPTGGTLKSAIAYDLPIAAGDVVQISGIVLLSGEKLVVRSGTASALDISANGVDIAP